MPLLLTAVVVAVAWRGSPDEMFVDGTPGFGGLGDLTDAASGLFDLGGLLDGCDGCHF
ncbi:MAG: hypothetical protein ABI692_17600 [Terracoccus sp.]